MVRVVSLVIVLCAVGAAAPAQAGRASTARLVRTSLDDARAEVPRPSEARIIRSTLDDPSHAAFPLDDPAVRMIRVSLEEAAEFAPLAPMSGQQRTVRTTLD